MTQLKMSVADFLSGQGLMHEDSSPTSRMTAAIVALPRALDSVRLIGDEEKHATLLFFGETSSLPEEAKTTLVNTLQQAAQMFSPFSERIVEVSRLGSDTPPALVGKLSGHCLSQIRDVLQINPKFGEYMSNGTQHPKYIPHMTLAYPDFVDEMLIRESVRQIYRIQFDRLALWWNDERIEFPLGVNLDMGPEGELMTDSEASVGYMNHVGMEGKSLAHHGIKGMKWGIRRDRSGGGGGGGKKAAKAEKKEAKAEKKSSAAAKASMANMKAGSVITMLDKDGNPQTMVKKKDGSWQETFLSADAERLVRTAQKEGHELSTREVQEAINRANAINNYEKIFASDPNAALRQQVDAMRLQRDYAQMKAEMTPQKKSMVGKLVGATASAYGAYSALDKAVGGELSKQLGGKVAEKFDPTGTAAKVARDALKDRNSDTTSTANAQSALAKASKMQAEAQLSVLKLKKETGGSGKAPSASRGESLNEERARKGLGPLAPPRTDYDPTRPSQS